MARLCLSVLGPFQATLNASPLTEFRTMTARALLAYLAMHPGTDFRRDALATLLWPEHTQTQALNNLRPILNILRNTIGDQDAATPFLLVTPQTIQFNPHSDYWLDVHLFARVHLPDSLVLTRYRATIQPGVRRMNDAIALYRGNFLEDVTMHSEPFEEWLTIEREHWHRHMMNLLTRLARFYEQRGDYHAVIDLAQRQIGLEPWHEDAYRALMLAYTQIGQRTSALAQFALCQRALAEAFNAEPSTQFKMLYRQIAVESATLPVLPRPWHHVPMPPTPLIGRQDLVTQIEDHVLSPDSRLVTLTGQGGIGKTRLALAVANDLRGGFRDGVWFVSVTDLAGIEPEPAKHANQNLEPLVLKIAHALRLALSDVSQPPYATLRAYLEQCELLLVLDNLELVLERAADLIAKILRDAPDVIILATSRVPLNLFAERVVRVPGLPLPACPDDPSAAQSESVMLFVERAQRANPDFQLNAETLPGIVAVCQGVQGLPLGIELAAAWTKHYAPAQIARLIHNAPDQLGVPARDASERHRSLRALFESTWVLLTPAEQTTLTQVTVFRGGFDLTAARTVLAGDWNIEQTLAALVNVSLLERDPQGRYALHPLVGQFPAAVQTHGALEQAAAGANLESRHSAYYLNLIAHAESALQGLDSNRTLDLLQPEWDNIQHAWNWATRHAQIGLLAKTLEGLTLWLAMTGQFRAAEQMVQVALAHLRQAEGARGAARRDPDRRWLCRLLLAQASVHNQAGTFADALADLDHAMPLANQLDDLVLRAAIHLQRGIALWRQGLGAGAKLEFDQALTDARASFTQATLANHNALAAIKSARATIAATFEQFANCAMRQENFALAGEHTTAALNLYMELGGNRNEIHAAMLRGTGEDLSGDPSGALAYFATALRLAQQAGDLLPEMYALARLGDAARLLGYDADARTNLQTALDHARSFADPNLNWMILGALARVALNETDYHTALIHSQAATRLAEEMSAPFENALALTLRGDAERGLGNLDQAGTAYRAALAIHAELGGSFAAMLPRAGLAQVALARDTRESLVEAQAQIEMILPYLDEFQSPIPPIMTHDLFSLSVTCILVLRAANDARAARVLSCARERLRAVAETIGDHAARQSFLDHVAPHRALARLNRK